MPGFEGWRYVRVGFCKFLTTGSMAKRWGYRRCMEKSKGTHYCAQEYSIA